MKIKTVEIEGKTYAVMQDGKPVYVHDDGKEVAFDAPAAMQKITALNGEAMGHRQAKEAAETKLRAFEGIEDPAAARDALSKIKNFKDKDLVEAGKVEEIKAAAIAAVHEQYKPIVAERDTLQRQLDKEVRGGAFSRSKFISERVAVPPHMIEKTYGEHFKIKDGKLVPYDAAGKEIFSRVKPGEVADFDEALEILISADPFKDHILKGTGAGGGGAQQPGGGEHRSGKTISRGEYNKLSPEMQRDKIVKEGFTLTE